MPRSVRKELRLTPELESRVNSARGDVSFNRWVERAVEAALGACTPGDGASVVRQDDGGEVPVLRVPASASPRASTESPDSSWKDGRQARLNKRLGKS